MTVMQRNAVAKEEEQPSFQFEDVFSLRKPRDAKAGLASGLKSMAKGVLAGTVGLLAAPLIGAHQDGLRGLAKGTMAGVAGAVVLPVTGFIVGGAQIVRGVVNTPEAVRQSMLGRYWDEDTRIWIDRPTLALALDDDDSPHAWKRQRRRIRQNGSASGGGRGSSGTEEDFYALLGVPRDAGPELIKKQYYILARRLHPDKNPDDPQAKERFQRLGEAYQVLCNPELRKRYDAHGTDGLDVSFMDSGEFFTALFGSDRFDHLVGELVIAAAARNGGDLTPAQLKRLQLAREEKLCVMLAALLRRWVEEDYQGFKDSMAAEAAELATASFGEVMLHTVGRVYEAQAEIFLGNMLTGSLAAIRARGQSIKSQVNAASLALKVYKTQQQMEHLDRQHEQQQELLQQREVEQVDGEPAGSEVEGAAAVELKDAQPLDGGSAAAAAAEGPARCDQFGNSHPEDESKLEGAPSTNGCAGKTPTDSYQQPQSAAAAAAAAVAASAAAAAAAAAVATERAKLEEQALPIMLDAMWAANVLDIEATLRHVCRRVLNEPQVNKTVRRERARGLLELGRIFRAVRTPNNATAPSGSSTSNGGSSSAANKAQQQQRQQRTAKQQMEDAMMRVLEKRLQADVHS